MILIGFAADFGYIMTLMQIPLKVTPSSIEVVVRALYPFFSAMLLVLALLTYVPAISCGCPT